MNDERLVSKRELGRLLGIPTWQLDHILRYADVRMVKVGQFWSVPESELVKLADAQRRISDVGAALKDLEEGVGGKSDLREATRRIVELEAEVKALRKQVDDNRAMKAREALSTIPFDEALEMLSEVSVDDLDGYEHPHRLGRAKAVIRHRLNLEDAPKYVGQKPTGVPGNASVRSISTGVGKVDIWYWRTLNGAAWAKYGGPKPGSRIRGDTMHEVIKSAGKAARLTYGEPVRMTSQKLRFAILLRDEFACRYCGRKAPTVELHVDHVKAVADGGTNDPDNLVAACADCNSGKSDTSL